MPVLSFAKLTTGLRNAENRIFWGWLLLLTIAKLLFCGQEEILTVFGPHDDLWHVLAAERWYWQGDYSHETLYHLPLYSFFIRLVSFTGIPLRIVTEVLFCGSVAYLCNVLRRFGFTSLVAGLAAFLAIFHPTTIPIFNHLGAEILLVPDLISAVAASLYWWGRSAEKGHWRWAALAAFLWAINWNLRKESILILGILGVFFFLTFFHAQPFNLANLARRFVGAVILPLAFAYVLTIAVKTGNYLRWGLFETSIITSNGYVAAFKALQSIPPQPYLAYMPMTVEVRERAYAVSPAFREMRPFFENVGTHMSIYSKEFTDSRGMFNLHPREISAGWIYWALHDAAVFAGHGKTPVEEDRYLTQVANEIRRAQAEGKIGKRAVPVAFLDPVWSEWLPRLPASLAMIHRVSIFPKSSARETALTLSEQIHKNAYDRMANRRPHLLNGNSPDRFEIAGWARARNDVLQSLTLSSPDGPVTAQTSLLPVERIPDRSRFILQTERLTPAERKKANLLFKFRDAGEISVPIKSLPKVGQRFSGGPTNALTGQLDMITPEKIREPSTWKLQKKWERIYFPIVRIGQWSGLLVIGLLVVAVVRKSLSKELLVILFLLFVVIERFGFFAMLDASSWPGNQARYFLAVMPLQSMLIVLILGETLNTMRRFGKLRAA